jgi:hypothetical protein
MKGKIWLIIRGILIISFLIAVIIRPSKDPFTLWLYITTIVFITIGYLADLYDFLNKKNP